MSNKCTCRLLTYKCSTCKQIPTTRPSRCNKTSNVHVICNLISKFWNISFAHSDNIFFEILLGYYSSYYFLRKFLMHSCQIVNANLRCNQSVVKLCSIIRQKEGEEQQSLKLAPRQRQVWNVSDFIFLALAYEGWLVASPVPRYFIFSPTVVCES